MHAPKEDMKQASQSSGDEPVDTGDTTTTARKERDPERGGGSLLHSISLVCDS